MIIGRRKLTKLSDEVWRVVPGSNDQYQVSNYGRVKSFYNKTEGQILKTGLLRGFKTVQLRVNKKQQTLYVHRLVADIFIPKESDDCTYVIHLDGNKKNNRLSNLIWGNKDRMLQHQRKLRENLEPSMKISNSKLKEGDVRLLKSMLQRGVVQSQIAKLFCISEMQVTRIKRGENWGHVQV